MLSGIAHCKCVCVPGDLAATGHAKSMDSTTKSTVEYSAVPTVSPTAAVAAERTWSDENPSIYDLMAPFDRITHHVALLTLASPAEQCSALRDAEIVSTIVEGGIASLHCGDTMGDEWTPSSSSSSAIYVYDMDQCERQNASTVRCLVDSSRPSILFACGTSGADYDLSSTDAADARRTAWVQLHSTIATCNLGGNDTSFSSNILDDDERVEEYRPDFVPVVAMFVAIGRLCRHGDDWFRFENHECAPSNNVTPTVAGRGTNVTYCIEQQLPCRTQDCVVQMDPVYAIDTTILPECQDSTVQESVWFEGSTGTANDKNYDMEIRELLNRHEAFVDLYLNFWFCDNTNGFMGSLFAGRDPGR